MADIREWDFQSSADSHPIYVREWSPAEEPRAIVQLCHGVAEHIRRYDDFADFLTRRGFLVVGNDHLGHGQTARTRDELGFFSNSNGWAHITNDVRRLYKLMRERYPGLPYFMLGHSMGSFVVRTYLCSWPDGLTGAVLSGTGHPNGVALASGQLMARNEIRRHGPRFRSEKLNQLAFGGYNKAFAPNRTPSDWLSRDDSAVDKYVADPLCGWVPSASLFYDMFSGLRFITDFVNIKKMNRALPALFISGARDPVGDMGAGVTRVSEAFRRAGLRDVSVLLYPEARHEVLNETNKQEVWEDVLAWIESKLPVQ